MIGKVEIHFRESWHLLLHCDTHCLRAIILTSIPSILSHGGDLSMWRSSLRHLEIQGHVTRALPQQRSCRSTRCRTLLDSRHNVQRLFHCSPICLTGLRRLERTWSQEELDKLRSLLAQGINRTDIAKALDRSTYELKDIYRYNAQDQGYYTPERPSDVHRFRRHVRPQNAGEQKKFMWTEVEVDRVRELRISGLSYSRIAREINRPANSVARIVDRYKMDGDKQPRLRSREWTPDDDHQLVALRASGLSVEDIAKQLNRSTANVARRLRSSSKSFSAAVDRLIGTALKEGKTRAQIKAILPDRESTTVKQRVAKLCRGDGLAGGWPDLEVEVLLKMRAENCTWDVIAATLRRTKGSCQWKWAQVREPHVDTLRWTNEEIETLRELKAKSLSWQEISKALPRRTDVGCEQKWRGLPTQYGRRLPADSAQPLSTDLTR